jgi:hypothetical protein
MGIDYSDIVSAIWLFLLGGLSFTSILVNLAQAARIAELEKANRSLRDSLYMNLKKGC